MNHETSRPPLQIASFDRGASQKVFLRMLIALLFIGIVIALNLELIQGIYFRNQLTTTGFVVNGSILFLFLLGFTKIITSLLYYRKEEDALGSFISNIHTQAESLLDGVPKESLIQHRYQGLALMQRQHTPINHGAFAAALVASESTRTSLPKFINNILILTGVFGTIVSLSIALLGASNLLSSSADLGGMGLVMHGMSTALSTTITAIVCYLVFGYFFLKLADVQTRLLGAIEEVTTLHLLPIFQVSQENLVQEVGDLVRALSAIAGNMQQAQRNQAELEAQLGEISQNQSDYLQGVSNDLAEIRQLLREGFRLPTVNDRH